MRAIIRHSISYIVVFAIIWLFITSCANEIEINVAGDPVPVVWCLLNPDVNEQYVRLGRSFLKDPNHPELPPVTDSTVWNMPVKVYAEEWQNGLPVQTFMFNPIDAPPKDSGFFPDDNLRLFKSNFKPARLSTYHLYVYFPDDYRIITGITTIPGKPVVYDPLEIPSRKITLQTGVQFTVRWAPGTGYGIYQGLFHITYDETPDEQLSSHQVYIHMAPILGLSAFIEMTDIINGNRFFNEVVKQVPVHQGVERSIINVRFILLKGGEELALQVSPDLQTTTISNSLNQYTNLIHGIGIFSSMQQVSVNNLQLSNTTLNELAHSELTHNLGFKDIHGGDLTGEK